MNKKNKIASDRVFNIVNCAFLVLLVIIVAYPLYYVLVASISDPYEVYAGKTFLLPSKITIEGYLRVFKEKAIARGYINSIYYTVLGTLVSVGLVVSTGYCLSKKTLPFRRAIMLFYVITMYFGGGLIPTYLVVSKTGLLNSVWSLILPGGVAVYNVIVTRTYFESSIPAELYEAAAIDGSSNLATFFKIALPLAKPIIAVMVANTSALSPDNSEKPLVKQMNEAMGVTIEWNCVSGDTMTEKKNLILNSGDDMPDALMDAAMSDSELITAGSKGLLIALEDYINEETMPNLMKLIEKRPQLLATCTMPDGHIYGLPTISEMGFNYSDGGTYYIGAIPQFTAINTAWLEAVNMEMPTTVDELHDVLVAFKENDVNGNGDPTDEIPMSFIYPETNGAWCAGMSTFFAPFGCTDYQMDHRAIKDGKVYYQAASEEYKNAIAYYHDWFEEGLIDIEVFSQDSSQYIAKGDGDSRDRRGAAASGVEKA